MKAGHTWKSATCHSWAHFYGTSKFVWYYTWSLVRNWPQFLVLCVLCMFNLSVLAYLKSFRVFGRKSSFIWRTAFCPLSLHISPQVWTMHWNFLLATDLLHDLKRPCSLTGLCTCFQIRPPVSLLRTVHLHTWQLHSSNFIVRSGFPSWAALNGSKGGQHRFRCTCIEHRIQDIFCHSKLLSLSTARFKLLLVYVFTLCAVNIS